MIQNIDVEKVVICKQGESSENYERFKEIVKERNKQVLVVGQGDRIKIEDDLYFDILWPSKSDYIKSNILNNNAIVCKLCYKDFSMLFTGDIEAVAEEEILKCYKYDFEMLNATVLKVAHHGSKTSSIQRFVDVVAPKVALVGVGEGNAFGHPSDVVVNRFISIRCKVI